LIVVVSTGKAAVPIISIAMIAAVYGLQALIFILKREFMLIGWMVVYILACVLCPQVQDKSDGFSFPIYSVFLPIYSFWSMDDFSWGSTRKVIGEGNNKTIVYEDDMPYDDSMIPMKSFKGEFRLAASFRGSVGES
jgi:chitin synthase